MRLIDEAMRAAASASDADVDRSTLHAPLVAETLALDDGPGLRVIRPAGAVRGVMLYFHGGGFVFGDAAMHDQWGSELARRLDLASVSVDYRLAPQHRWPAQIADAMAAARWLVGQALALFGTQRLVVGGGSVGATLGLQCLLRARDEGLADAFCGADLVAGNYDLSGTPSQRAATDAQFLNPERLAETRRAGFPGRDGAGLRDPAISALYADLSGLPPMHLTVGQNDAVVDDSVLLAARLETAGVACELTLAPGADHLFLMEGGPLADEARARAVQFLDRCLQAGA